ncbi:branched-chain amino acid ABC transporter permease [Telmatospirillum sp. J64-1]|uniref:branched-chain amino acid ABC transporter permease n=1 Tax=Telmatospirillum sp. J64-1 TaxID=2502183 RepID=UPI00115E87A7|nr:branched-chain amino acid ABC transporter permease [Telmatospirillum sp. J64-1]
MNEAVIPSAALPKGPFGLRRNLLPAVLFLAFALAPLAVAFGADPFFQSILIRIMIFAIAAISLDLILGFGGMVSLGHAAFIGIGAYAVGILASHGIEEAHVQLPITLAVASLFALVTGAISLRTKGVYFIMITLAFAQMIMFFATSLSAYGGDDGLTIWTRSQVFGSDILGNRTIFYYVTFAVMLGCYLLCRAMVVSRFGRVLRGSKENPVRMEAIGFSPYRFQLAAYVIAGMMCSLAGFLLANQAEFVSPAYMSWQRSGELLIMVILGGLGSLHGAVIGAAALLLLEEGLAGFTEHWKIILGPLLVLVALFLRQGILGLLTGKKNND